MPDMPHRTPEDQRIVKSAMRSAKIPRGKRRRILLWLLPLPDGFDDSDPVAVLILNSIRVFFYAIVLGGIIAAGALYVGIGARAASNVSQVNGERESCVVDLRSLEFRAQGREMDAILLGLAAIAGYPPEELDRYVGDQLPDDLPADDQVILEAVVERGLEALEARRDVEGDMTQPRLDELCGEAAG